jgi:hypothetical protein
MFGRICNGSSWSILCPFGLFYDHLVYFALFILWLFGIFLHALVCCHKKNLAALLASCVEEKIKCAEEERDGAGRHI